MAKLPRLSGMEMIKYWLKNSGLKLQGRREAATYSENLLAAIG